MVFMTFGAYIQPKGTIPGWYIWVRRPAVTTKPCV